MTTTIAPPAAVIPRDRWGRPLITPPGGGKPVAYTRATTVAETLDDRYNLELWKMRQVASGLAARPDLVALAASKGDNKDDLNRICADAMDAASSGAAANLGTAVHRFVEQINRGADPMNIPAKLRADLDAYREAVSKFEILHAERFLVLDELKIGGTADVIMREKSTGRVVIGDVKTGMGAVTYGQTAIAVQLAIYSRGVIYHHDTGEREPIDVDPDTAIVLHMPVGTGTCVLHEVDIARGWEAVQHALWVREWRKSRNLFTPAEMARGTEPAAESATEAAPSKPGAAPDFLREIARAPSVLELEAIYRAAVKAGADRDLIVKACAARKALLAA